MSASHLSKSLLIAVLMLVSHALWAQPLLEEDGLRDALKKLDSIESELRHEPSQDVLNKWVSDVSKIRSQSNDCISQLEQNVAGLNKDLQSLGERVKGEAVEVTRKRNTLRSDKTSKEKNLAICRLISLRSEEMANRIAKIQKQSLAQELLARGPGLYRLIRDNLDQPPVWVRSSWHFIRQHSGLQLLSIAQLTGLGIVVLAGLVAGLILRRRAVKKAQAREWDVSFGDRFGCCLYASFSHYFPHLIVSILLAGYFFLATRNVEPLPFINVVTYALPIVYLLIALTHIFLAPLPPAKLMFDISEKYARRMARRLKILILLLFVGYLLFATIFAQSLPEEAILLARGVFAAFLILNLAWVVWLLGKLFRVAQTPGLRTVFIVLLFGVLICEWLGYRNLSLMVLRGVVGTLFALGGLWLLKQLIKDLFHNLATGKNLWQQRLRRVLGVRYEENIPGLSWFETLTQILLWLLFLFAVLYAWGLSDTVWQQVNLILFEGFAVGSLKIIPARLFMAVVAFALLLVVTSWSKRELGKRWLSRTAIERGAQEAIVTISGYVGVAIALLVALGIAGVQFANLAIIAGALSVGIGFGLQNIVNNFVSGLILLFERPIKTGDWVVVGNTEGYVKRIRIRSTQIQTFDRADVIVPNSELISSQVTNWVLYDERGRVRLPVGVAYGSDTQKVKDILLQVAADHPRVIHEKGDYAPQVLFLQFGESSLDFELRVFVKNINKRLAVLSDLNFAIDAAFRENNVEIPFPQRDLHVRNWPKQGKPPEDIDKGE